MQLWQLDLIELPLADGTKIKVLTGVDDHSRYCVSAQVMTRATGRAVCQGLAAALGRYGVPEEILTRGWAQPPAEFPLGDRGSTRTAGAPPTVLAAAVDVDQHPA